VRKSARKKLLMKKIGGQKENRRIRRLAIKSEWVVHPLRFDFA